MSHALRAMRIGIDTNRQPIAYLRRDCHVCRSEGFAALTRIQLVAKERKAEAVLNVTTDGIVGPGQIGLSDSLYEALGVAEGDVVAVSHPPPLESFSRVRAKIYGDRLGDADFAAIVKDIAQGRYPDVHLSAFLTACAATPLDLDEVTALTRAMVAVGDRLDWGGGLIADKHCIGGLPGNRTTPIVVAIVAAHGLRIPKTSSRAITSPAGTADVVDTFTRATLSLKEMRQVVEGEGGCLAWGGAARLSPVDDLLIRVEHPLDIDSEGQLVASVLSKKAAAGSTHVVLDLPVGPTAKLRTPEAAERLAATLTAVGTAVGLTPLVVLSDGRQPVGRGVGPALEAHDVLGVLRNAPDAPSDLRLRAVALAGKLLELDPAVSPGTGEAVANRLLDEGRAWQKLLAIAEAQGGFREPGRASHVHDVVAHRTGRVAAFDNRRLSRVAKLAGAPNDPTAGLVLHAPLGAMVRAGDPLYTVHAESRGELHYALEYAYAHPEVVAVEDG